ncbi:MAG: hypothetical protein ABW160_12065, partial [Candidatus Thiodiazotropha sp. 4PDIV1]
MDKPTKIQRRRADFVGASAEYIDQLYEAFCEEPDNEAVEKHKNEAVYFHRQTSCSTYLGILP